MATAGATIFSSTVDVLSAGLFLRNATMIALFAKNPKKPLE
jgi:hypothetical protein